MSLPEYDRITSPEVERDEARAERDRAVEALRDTMHYSDRLPNWVVKKIVAVLAEQEKPQEPPSK